MSTGVPGGSFSLSLPPAVPLRRLDSLAGRCHKRAARDSAEPRPEYPARGLGGGGGSGAVVTPVPEDATLA